MRDALIVLAWAAFIALVYHREFFALIRWAHRRRCAPARAFTRECPPAPWRPPPGCEHPQPPVVREEHVVHFPPRSRADRRFCAWAAATAEPENDRFDRANRRETEPPPRGGRARITFDQLSTEREEETAE